MRPNSYLNLIRAYFTEGSTIYDTNHAPVAGQDQIGSFWFGTRER